MRTTAFWNIAFNDSTVELIIERFIRKATRELVLLDGSDSSRSSGGSNSSDPLGVFWPSLGLLRTFNCSMSRLTAVETSILLSEILFLFWG